MNLSICLATRGRPERLLPTIGRTLCNIGLPDTRLIVAVDDDDHATIDALAKAPFDERVMVSVAPREDTMGDKYNRVLKLAPADVYLPMVDYAAHVTPGFDRRIIEAAERFPDRIGVVYNHMANQAFPQIIAITAKLAHKMGFFVPPGYPYWFWDQEIDDIAKMINRIAFADVWLDCGDKPATQELRDFHFWQTYSNARMLVRRRIAQAIIRDPEFQEPQWRKQLQLECHPVPEEATVWRNRQVTAELAGRPQPPPDARYERIKANATRDLFRLVAEIESEAFRVSYDHPFAQQNPIEIKWLCEQVRGAKVILEVGSCFGHSLRLLAEVAAPKARIRSIDFGDGTNWNRGQDTSRKLKGAADDLRAKGFDVGIWFGDSHSPWTIDWAKANAPYDVVFIDGDHSYDGVKADWENYGPMGRVVAFHDIAHEGHDVRRLWNEIKSQGYQTEELILSQMGIGLVRREVSGQVAA